MIAYRLVRRRDATYHHPSDCAKTSHISVLHVFMTER